MTQEKKHKPASRPSVLSEEKIFDSDSDDQQPHRSSVKVVQPPEIKMAADRKPRDALLRAQKLKALVPKPLSEVDSGEEETAKDKVNEEESDEGSEASSSSGTKRPAPTKAAALPRKKAKPTPPTAIAPKAFKPPSGFKKTTFSSTDYAADSTTFLTEDLTGKQIWHITAPASVNIKDIKPFNIQDVRSGKPVFSKNGIDYGFLTGLHKTERLLLASEESVEYAPTKAPVSGTYHLRELGRSKVRSAVDANKENESIRFTAVSTVPSRKPREQPTGIRMRYQPYGSLPMSKEGTSPTSAPTFRIPGELPESQLSKSERKKQRKEKKTEEREASHDASAMYIDQTPSSAVKNASSGTPAKSASAVVEATFEAATETHVKEKNRKKKKHKLVDETDS
jgi:DNA-directed RNA polymerase I subunit RPA34.5